MNWIAELDIAASGIVSVFVVLILLYGAMLLLGTVVGKLESSKTSQPRTEGKS